MPQTEDARNTGGQTLPPNAAGAKRSTKHWLALSIALIAVVALLVSGIWSRVKARTALKKVTDQSAVTAVSVVSPKATTPTDELILPGNVQPFITSPIYARTNGYLKKWYYDIGAHVKQGQLLAVIETPEVDQQLQQARSNLLTAQANLELASITKTRYQGLLKSNAVSQQQWLCCARLDDYVLLEVGLLGATDGFSVDAREHASLSETVPYEILCGISKRVPRKYRS